MYVCDGLVEGTKILKKEHNALLECNSNMITGGEVLSHLSFNTSLQAVVNDCQISGLGKIKR
jgi:hypothetical protein